MTERTCWNEPVPHVTEQVEAEVQEETTQFAVVVFEDVVEAVFAVDDSACVVVLVPFVVVATVVEVLEAVVEASFAVVVMATVTVLVVVVVVAFGLTISQRIPSNPYGHTQSKPPNVPK